MPCSAHFHEHFSAFAFMWRAQDPIDGKSTLARKWFGAVRQPAISCANVDPDLCRHGVTRPQLGTGTKWPIFCRLFLTTGVFMYISAWWRHENGHEIWRKFGRMLRNYRFIFGRPGVVEVHDILQTATRGRGCAQLVLGIFPLVVGYFVGCHFGGWGRPTLSGAAEEESYFNDDT